MEYSEVSLTSILVRIFNSSLNEPNDGKVDAGFSQTAATGNNNNQA